MSPAAEIKQRAFHIVGTSGFQITFANGWKVSVIWWPGTYSDNEPMGAEMARNITRAAITYRECGERGVDKAEVAIIDPHGKMHVRPEWGEGPTGKNYTANQVLDLMNWASEQ